MAAGAAVAPSTGRPLRGERSGRVGGHRAGKPLPNSSSAMRARANAIFLDLARRACAQHRAGVSADDLLIVLPAFLITDSRRPSRSGFWFLCRSSWWIWWWRTCCLRWECTCSPRRRFRFRSSCCSSCSSMGGTCSPAPWCSVTRDHRHQCQERPRPAIGATCPGLSRPTREPCSST